MWDQRVYCMASLSSYLSLLVKEMHEFYLKDYKQRIIHHISAITLIVFTLTNNLFHVGTVILLVHEPADFLLNLSKMANYLKYQSIYAICSVTFTIVWFVTRLGIQPLIIYR